MAQNKPIKVCFFTKYPPIEGGTSGNGYWFSRALGKRGVEMHVITNALEVEEEFREKIDFSDPQDRKEYQPKNVFVHNLGLGPNLHIPYSPAYLERLINLGLRVIKEYDCDIIDSLYIQPYGVAAAFTKLLTGKPFILRHAGSDITHIFSNEQFNTLYRTIFNIADLINTTVKQKEVFLDCGVPEERIYLKSFGGINPEYFNPQVKPADLAKLGVPRQLLKKPILTYLGKYNEHKSLTDLVKAASSIRDDFLLLFVTGGFEFEEFKTYLKKFPALKDKHYFLNFLPPWRVPSLIRASNCLIHLQSGFPLKGIKANTPNQPIEAFATATPVLMSNEIFLEYQRVFALPLENGKNTLAVNPQNHKDLKNALLKIIKNPKEMKEIGRRGHEEVFKKNSFESSLEAQISIYQTILGKRKNKV